MYVECILISRDRTIFDEQISRLMNKQGALSIKEVQNSQAYRSSIRTNPKYIDPELSRQSVIRNQKLKFQLAKHKIQTVLVSPLKADLQTCYDLLGRQAITVIIVPELVPIINSVSSIADKNSALILKFKQQSQIKIQTHPEQNFSLKVKQEQNVHKSLNDRILEMQNTLEYETIDHYYERLTNFKKSLINHIALTNKKITIVAHREVLEFLTSTGYYENYQLVNKVAFGFGQIKTQHIMIQGAQGQLQNKSIPFCSCS